MILRFLHLLAPRNTERPVEEHGCTDVERDIYPEQAKVSPARIPIRVDAPQELIGVVHLAVLAFAHRLRIAQKATSVRNVVAHVL
jgi:hypothetical protein